MIFDQKNLALSDVLRHVVHDLDIWSCRYGRLSPAIDLWKDWICSKLYCKPVLDSSTPYSFQRSCISRPGMPGPNFVLNSVFFDQYNSVGGASCPPILLEKKVG